MRPTTKDGRPYLDIGPIINDATAKTTPVDVDMVGLELLDQELADLQKQVDDLTAKIAEKEAVRVEAEKAAATVKLAVVEEK